MVNQKTASALTIAALLVCTVPVKSIASLVVPVVAQATPSFPLPDAVEQGTAVRISSGSDNMNAISEALRQGFEGRYEGSVAITTKSADEALADVLNDNADVAAISRPLTAEEEAQGFIAVPVRREKIAVVVDADNPFSDNITSSQFAQIFRGEITDWSEVGGPAGPIRVIDRPDTSETRLALKPYPVFETAEFKTGSNATQLSEDSTAALAKELGSDGIGYALVGQLEGQPDLKALPLHQTLPSSPQYPFSQPYSLVYAKAASPAAAAFLGYATGNEGQSALQNADISNEGAALPNQAAGNESGSNADAGISNSAESGTVPSDLDLDTDGTTADGETAGTSIGQMNADGRLVDTEGNLISPEGFLVDDNGNLIDAEGNPLPAGAVGIPGVGLNLGGDAGEDSSPEGTNLAIGEETDGMNNAVGGTRLLSERGRWWWLLLPLAGLGLLIWAAGKRGSEEEAGYSSTASGVTDDRVRNAFREDTPNVDTPSMDAPSMDAPSMDAHSSGTNRAGMVGAAGLAASSTGLAGDTASATDDVEDSSQYSVENHQSSAIKDSSWLDRAKQRINEASKDLENTAAEIEEDIAKQD